MKHQRSISTPLRLASISILICSSSLFALEPVAPDPIESLPSLDELLGLDDNLLGEQPIVDPNQAELDRVLSPKQAGEAFSQAVELMNQVSSRIANSHDLSIATQRLQEDILRKLDQVIESANENESGNNGSSSSSSQSESSQSQPDQQQQSKEGQSAEPSDSAGESSMPGGSSNAQPGDEVVPDGAGWGALPARFREALSQGISDHYSELYRSITEAYYKSLAEDKD